MKTLFYSIVTTVLASLFIPLNGSSQCTPSQANNTLSTNNVSTLIHSAGDLYWDFNNTQYEVPRGSGRTTTFSGGIWMGGKDVSGQLRMAVSHYRQKGVDFWPGPINSAGAPHACADYDKVWKITRQEVDDFKNNPSSITFNITNWPGKGNPNIVKIANQALAPFVDVDNDGIYNPQKGDYPKFLGDEALYSVFNDLGNVHTESGSNQMGIEVHLLAYSFVTTNHVNNATFYEYTIINKGGNNLSDVYLGLFTDFDLGGPADDFVGCDTNRNMGFVYNGDPFDDDSRGALGYGANPPLGAIKMVKDVRVGNQTYPMSSFKRLTSANSDNPTMAVDYYNFIQGLNKNGLQDTMANGQAYKFAFHGKVSNSREWSECSAGESPGERKILMNYGPFDFAPQQVLKFTFANMFARSINSNYSSCSNGLTPIMQAADTVQDYMDKNGVHLSTPVITPDEVNFKVYPNPAQNIIQVNGPENGFSLMIKNMAGQTVAEYTSNTANNTYDIQDLESGMYLMQLTNKDNVVSIRRLVKD